MKTILTIIAASATFALNAQCDPVPIFNNDTTHAVCWEEIANTRHCISNNIPDHVVGPFPPAVVIGQDFEYYMCKYPEIGPGITTLGEDTSVQFCSVGIIFGVSMHGVNYSPYARLYFVDTFNSQENHDWEIEAEFILTMDANGGHLNNLFRYHYHTAPIDYIVNDLGIDGSDHSPILGYAADGFPIYYKHLYTDPADASGGVSSFDSGYSLKTGNRPGNGISAPNGPYDGNYLQDYEYDGASTELDECGLRYGVTPDYPNGTYYYVMTENWPWIPRCLRGLHVDNTFLLGPNCPASSASNDCSDWSTMGIENVKDEIELSFYPNPAQNLLQIGIEEQYKDQITSISIYSSNGKQVFSSSTYEANIDLSQVISGSYFVQINFGEEQVTKKLIVQ